MSEQLEQAADWLDQLESLSAQQQEAFSQWFALPANQKAFARVAKAMGSVELVAVAESLSKRQDTIDNLVDISNVASSSNPVLKPDNTNHASKKTHRNYIVWGIAASLAVVTFLSLVMTPFKSITPSAPEVVQREATVEYMSELLATGVAEQRSKVLQDGSVVFLNGDSELDVQHTSASRDVYLNQGQAYFDIAKDQDRPFVIHLDDAQVKVVGTAFDIDRLNAQTTIRVYEGVVELISDSETVLTLVKGQSAQLIDNIWQAYLPVDEQMLPEWRSGWLTVNDESLAVVVEKLSRFLSKPVVIEANHDVEITGRFNLLSAKESLVLLSSSSNMHLAEYEDRYTLSLVEN